MSSMIPSMTCLPTTKRRLVAVEPTAASHFLLLKMNTSMHSTAVENYIHSHFSLKKSTISRGFNVKINDAARIISSNLF